MTKTLVLDANILIRAVLGTQVDALLRKYADTVLFVTVHEAFEDARAYLPVVISKRGGDEAEAGAALEKLSALEAFVQSIPSEVVADLELAARERLARRDEDDWAFLALALHLHCPIWTEDKDFFGCGVATWTSNKVEIFLRREGGVGS